MKKNSPLACIEIHDGYARVRIHDGPSHLNKVVAIETLAGAFSGISLNSGVLPENTLFHGRVGDTHHVAVYIPPQLSALKAVRRTYHVPLPGLVFYGHGHSYYLYAVRGDSWPDSSTRLYRSPMPNVGGGHICMGNAAPPACTPGTIYEAWEVFREALFTGHNVEGQCKSHDNVMDLWAALEKSGATVFPDDELIYADITLGRVAREAK